MGPDMILDALKAQVLRRYGANVDFMQAVEGAYTPDDVELAYDALLNIEVEVDDVIADLLLSHAQSKPAEFVD